MVNLETDKHEKKLLVGEWERRNGLFAVLTETCHGLWWFAQAKFFLHHRDRR